MKVPAASASEASTSVYLAPYPRALAGAQPFTASDEPIACTTSKGAAALGCKEPGIGRFPDEATARCQAGAQGVSERLHGTWIHKPATWRWQPREERITLRTSLQNRRTTKRPPGKYPRPPAQSTCKNRTQSASGNTPCFLPGDCARAGRVRGSMRLNPTRDCTRTVVQLEKVLVLHANKSWHGGQRLLVRPFHPNRCTGKASNNSLE